MVSQLIRREGTLTLTPASFLLLSLGPTPLLPPAVRHPRFPSRPSGSWSWSAFFNQVNVFIRTDPHSHTYISPLNGSFSVKNRGQTFGSDLHIMPASN